MLLPSALCLSAYEYSEEELQQIYDELEFQMSRLKERFNGKQAFSLGADSGVVPCKCSRKIPKNLLN